MVLRAHCSLRLLTGTVFSLLALAAPAAAQDSNVTLDFEELATPVTPEFGVPSPIETRGFIVQATSGGDQQDFGVWGSDPELDPSGSANYAGSTAVFSALVGTQIDILYSDPSRPFNLRSIDVAPLFGTSTLGTSSFSTFGIRFFGFHAGSTVPFFQDFLISTPGSGNPTFTTLTFGNGWRGLDQVSWFQQSTIDGVESDADAVLHQFDNIQLQVVPEPASVLLMGSGLMLLGVGAATRRRRSVVLFTWPLPAPPRSLPVSPDGAVP